MNWSNYSKVNFFLCSKLFAGNTNYPQNQVAPARKSVNEWGRNIHTHKRENQKSYLIAVLRMQYASLLGCRDHSLGKLDLICGISKEVCLLPPTFRIRDIWFMRTDFVIRFLLANWSTVMIEPVCTRFEFTFVQIFHQKFEFSTNFLITRARQTALNNSVWYIYQIAADCVIDGHKIIYYRIRIQKEINVKCRQEHERRMSFAV